MDKVRVHRFRPYDQRKLHRLKRQRRNAVNRMHARIILLSRGGVRNRDIARQVDCSPQWVRQIIHRYNDGGLDGIVWFPYHQVHGRPRTFPAQLREEIAEVALSSPKALIGLTQWSLSKLRAYLIEQQIVAHISLEWLRQLLKRMKISLRRTKTWKESTDPQFWPKYRAIRRLYQRPRQNGRRLCVDEFGPLNLRPRHGHCRAKDGKVDRLRATYSRKHGVRHFLAAYDLESDRIFGQFTRQKRWTEFLPFLQWVRRHYPRGQTLHIVLDNYGPHLKWEVITWAITNKVYFYFTPTKASWLNRIECQFAGIKKFALENSDYRSHEEQMAAIESYLNWRNGDGKLTVQSWNAYQRQRKKNVA